MDSWLRFQHYTVSELWGRRERARAGNGKTGASAVMGEEANPLTKHKALCGANFSSEACEPTAGKSRYSVQCTRTVNRHRWMRRES